MSVSKSQVKHPASPHDAARVSVTIGGKNLGRGTVKSVTWGGIAKVLLAEDRDAQLFEAFLKLTKPEQLPYKNRNGWIVGGTCENGERKCATVLKRSIVTIDFDGMSTNTWDLLYLIGLDWPFESIWHTTRSHQSGDIRVRVFILLSREVTNAEYSALVVIAAAKIDPSLTGFDPRSAQPEQAMFLPTVCKDGEFKSGRYVGNRLEPDEVLLPFKDASGAIDPTRLPKLPATENTKAKNAGKRLQTGLTPEEFHAAVMAIPNNGTMSRRAPLSCG